MTVAIILLRSSIALLMIIFGIHQYLSPGRWFEYIPAMMKRTPTMSPHSVMRIHSAGNIILGLFLITGFKTLIAAWIVFIWWLSMLPFSFMEKWSTGLRDTVIAISLLALIFLLG